MRETFKEKGFPMKRDYFFRAAALLLALAAMTAAFLLSPAPATSPPRPTAPSPAGPPDTDPPEIHGARDLYVSRYSAPAYRQGVTVTDTAGEVTLEVDSAGVDTDTPGEYTVTYIARDAAGNESRATARVIVSAVTEEELTRLAAPVLNSIRKPGMSDTEKALAIHTWIWKNISYTNTGDKNNVMEGAYNGLTLRSGDCYTFYALAKYFLDCEGIVSIDMRRVEGAGTRHYWLALDLGDGWHHYDACPVLRKYSAERPRNGFMMTESEAQGFANGRFNHPDYYRYDPAQCLPEGVGIVP